MVRRILACERSIIDSSVVEGTHMSSPNVSIGRAKALYSWIEVHGSHMKGRQTTNSNVNAQIYANILIHSGFFMHISTRDRNRSPRKLSRIILG